MKKDKENSSEKKSGKGVLGLAATVIVVIVLFFRGVLFGGSGEGNGGGLWTEAMNIVDNLFEPEKDTDTQQENPEKESKTETEDKNDAEDLNGATDLTDAAKEPEQLPDVIIVTIREDKVFVGDKEFADADGLKKYIEEIGSDEREFKLQDENSILATYEWVTKVFKDLKVPLFVPAEN